MTFKALSFVCGMLGCVSNMKACCDYGPLMDQTYEYSATSAQEMSKLLKDTKLHIFFCGTGNPQVSMQDLRKPSCLAVIGNNEFFLFDAGEGTSQTLASLALPYPAITKAFMTHWHSDHFAGLGALINNSWKDGRTTPFYVYGPYGVDKVVNGLNEAYYLDILFRAINGQDILDPSVGGGVPKFVGASRTPQEVYNYNDIKISSFSVDHAPSYPAVGYKLDYKNCHVTVSGDTKVVESLAKASQDVDVLISEVLSASIVDKAVAQAKADKSIPTATLDEDIKVTNDLSGYHANSYDLAKLAAKSNVKNLYLTHLVPAIDNSIESKENFTSGMAKDYKGPITVANDKDHLILESTQNGCTVTFAPYVPTVKSTLPASAPSTTPAPTSK